MSGLDWPGLMRAGMRGLGLAPDQFWRLTPAELALMLGAEPGGASMTRARLAELVGRFPDGAGGALPRRRSGDSPRYLDKEEAGGPGSGR